MKKIITALLFAPTIALAQNSSFFEGYIKACQHSPAYENFQKKLCAQGNSKDPSICSKGQVVLPAGMKGAITSSKNEGEFTMFEVQLENPVDFAGNKVVALEQWTGHDNGIWGTALVVQAKSVREANALVKSSGVKFEKVKSEIGELKAQVISGKDNKIRIMCDTSN